MSTTAVQRQPTRELPRRWDWLFHGFQRYATRYVRRHFHAVRISKTSHPLPPGDEPIIAVLNHPSWWDPMLAMSLVPLFPGYKHFAAIDAVAVAKYRFFERIGFVGVDTNSLRGAVQFLRAGEAILSHSNTIFWVTAQGRFTDVRERPLALRSGVGHLAARLERGWVLPITLEYTFWTERTPEALVRFGEPLDISNHLASPGRKPGEAWTNAIEDALTQSLDVLNREAMTRDPERFTTHISGKSGVGGVYDLWRRGVAWARGRRFDPSHAGTSKEQP